MPRTRRLGTTSMGYVPLAWRFKTSTMMGLIALIGFGFGLFNYSWRNVWGPWPRWVRSLHSSVDYQAAANEAVAAVDGRVPDVLPESAVRELISALDVPNPGTQAAAIVALGKAGPKAVGSVPKLLVQLKAPPPVGYYAAGALGQIVRQSDPEYDAVVSALLAAADGPFPRSRAYGMVRAYTLQSLIQVGGLEGRRRADIERLLYKSINHENAFVRTVAGLGLIRAGRGEDSRAVLAAFHWGDEGYENARLGLGLLGSKTADDLWILGNVMRTGPDPWLKRAARDALKRAAQDTLGK